MKILLTGGTGYIGGITARFLEKKGYEVIIFDKLKPENNKLNSSKFIIGDLTKKSEFKKLGKKHFDAIMHFASYALVEESMKKPSQYFYNNIVGGLNLLEYMKKNNIKYIIFSSSCAIYGKPEKVPVIEKATRKPESVYGQSKVIFEDMLYWYDKIYDIKHINLRYFNAAGAALDGSLGENHKPETHIIPRACQAALDGKPFQLYGTDYETKDGTAMRDYIHVEDLARAHYLSFKRLLKMNKSDSFNLGGGKGYSNKEVLAMIKKISGIDFEVNEYPRRSGDPSKIYANNKKAKQKLGFTPKYSDLKTIVKTAWKWHRNRSIYEN